MSIDIRSWHREGLLRAGRGAASPSASTVTFTVNANATGLASNNYAATNNFINSDTGQGTQRRGRRRSSRSTRHGAWL